MKGFPEAREAGRLAVVGAVSLLGQAVVLRETAVAFYGNELIYALALGAWLAGSAAGAYHGRRRSVPGEAGLRARLLAFALVLVATIALARGLRQLLGGVPGATLGFGAQIAGLALCVVPSSAVAGSLFRRAATSWVARGGSFAGAYAWESAGALAGGVAATLLLAVGVSNLAAGILCALVAAAAASLPLKEDRARTVTSSLVAAALLAALVVPATLDRRMTAWSHPDLVQTRDTPYGRIGVTARSGQVAVFVNDALAYESEGTGAEELVHLAAVQRDRPRTVLVLGGVTPGLLPEILDLSPESVTDFELDRGVTGLVASLGPEHLRSALADARVRILYGDPRELLERADPADLILVAMPEPDSGGANRFYTREFFRTCARKLAPGGVLAFRLRGAENLWTPLAVRRAASIVAALRAAFADVVVLPATTQVFLASTSPLDRDPDVLAARLAARGAGPRLVTPAYVRYLYTNDRFAGTAAALARTVGPVNTDRRPVCYAATMLYELSRLFPRLATSDLSLWEPRRIARTPWPWVALVAAAALVALARYRDAWRRGLLAGLAGGAGMVLECALLLGYQTHAGVLYRDLGILMTAFMAGLAVGAAAVARTGSSTPKRLATVAAFVALALAAAVWLFAGSPGGLTASSALLLVLGVLVAALVAHAALFRRPDPLHVVAPVYAADLLGGAAGSLLAGLALIPILGLPGTAVAAAVAIGGAMAL